MKVPSAIGHLFSWYSENLSWLELIRSYPWICFLKCFERNTKSLRDGTKDIIWYHRILNRFSKQLNSSLTVIRSTVHSYNCFQQLAISKRRRVFYTFGLF